MEDGALVNGNLNKLVARSFPSKEHHVEEFVLLEHRANSPVKVNLFSDAKVAMKDATFKANIPEEALNNLRAFLAVDLYFSDNRIYTTYGNQAARMSRVLGKIWAQLKAGKKNFAIGDNWQTEWDKYMDAQWSEAYSKLTNFFHAKVKEMNTKLGCASKKNDADCDALKEIDAKWKSGVKEANLKKLSYARSEGSAVDADGDTVMDG
ncbi:hypothetical protein EKO04_002085 [Ascochyta lentis]|uniref:Uncharacterized protein n=1 Tax=Ascochyta lentis TaxID=205686 RepID=A0A8H7JBX1_9PLEO|nr:hypothetical protein EKO04_002085 [Ascochyta lentis]